MITIQLPTNPQPPENTSTPCKDLTNDHCKSEERPCEKYLQFMDSSRQERTFMIEKLIGKLSKPYSICLSTPNT
ncbi:hypothetical protein G6F55_012013 [Rhizopus delemar]|jgi:hypothetical protein|uniref:Uncharacterized protein n=1 Tax=Rhizopus delemar (strain RA 99-880 / ATCC MYA-4621 / FGSC 9543 / NRRL 43880) TaxID=246409 RepID=I1BU48_RHIO9|nr:hypothetical protein RO3G_04433 [Rhizopus delemar RA 99-880]KAG0760358.1 hypothetical protein G6F22_019148 [Rhizopus arrhizus]KAG1445305.1 hypothetical protein G6F55_012013 [Rhizopus delemar]KAG1490186.1 hypothetical protein G6F52_013638 [Rhizopus delemar]KAG1506008.1 hypothetical protein G6F53_010003 [Rhizopus delemar]|eukprot:EIE79728.1 hypothetical protein RO3G_04433 [Rhizopus delemar RA 99-880]